VSNLTDFDFGQGEALFRLSSTRLNVLVVPCLLDTLLIKSAELT